MPTKRDVSILFAAVFSALASIGTAAAADLTRPESRLLGAVNSARVAYGLRPLRVDDRLERAARSHSSSMMHTNAFTHGSFLARVRSFGARGPVLGENLAWGTGGFAAPAEIVREWLASPEHRANLLRPGYRRVGIGIMQGSFQGYPGALIATADFGGR